MVSSSGDGRAAFFSAANFSTGKLSPVSEPWMTNRSLATKHAHVGGDHVAGGELHHVAGDQVRRSASLAAAPSRSTVALTVIIALSLAAALSALAS